MRLLVIVMLAGCVQEVPPAPVVPVAVRAPPTTRRPVVPDCVSLRPVMERTFSYSGLQDQVAPIVDAITQSCTEDGWSKDLIRCLIDASDTDHMNACAKLLTKDQGEHLQSRLMVAMNQSASPPSSLPPPPAPAPWVGRPGSVDA